MRTLHGYFGRELLKTFLMTAAALTLLVVMGGGVANLFRGEGVGAEDMAKIILYLAPVALTLILPVAALFSAVITFGRAALDNEILACRAAGINIHRLLFPPLLLGLAITGFTYVSWNYMIPYLMRSIEDITRRDLPSIVLGQFQKARPLSYGRFRITAKTCTTLGPDDLPEELPKAYLDGHTLMRLGRVCFLEVEDQEVLRFGTADETIIVFDHTGATPRVTVDMQGGRSFDDARRQYYEFEHQILGPFDIPLPIKRKIKFETLDRLRAFDRDPMTVPEIQDLLHGMRRWMKSFFLCQEVQASMDPDLGGNGTYRLHGENLEILLFAEQYAIDRDESRVSLRGVRAELRRDTEPNVTYVYTADTATIELRSGLQRLQHVIEVELNGHVRVSRAPGEPTDRIVNKPKETLPTADFDDQPTLSTRFGSFNLSSLFEDAEASALDLYPKQQRLQRRLFDKLRASASEVQGEIHFRASYSLCATAIVLLGAMLGIIVRGGQVLTAFGVSCVPMLFVVVASIVGRNLADRPDYALTSICVMWGATAVTYLATTFVGSKILPR